MQKNKIKLLDMEMKSKIKGKKNISFKRLDKFIRAFQVVLKQYLLQNRELFFKNFVKLGPRIAKDRIAITAEYADRPDMVPKKVHIPQHLRFRALFCQEFKNYLNKE